MSNQAAVTQPKTTSAPANGADEPPPHMGYDSPAPTSMAAPVKLFDKGERSQTTQIEQARVIAEVQGAIVVAQNNPRDMDAALQEMRTVCRIEMMADRAFFSYEKGGTTINRGSIHLARELARIWGNLTYGIKELARHDTRAGELYGESEMLAYAWDLQTNTRPETTFIVPHYMDLKGGNKKALKDARSIYENNANMGARRLREQILAVIPRWFTDEAEDICRQTLEHGGGKPIKQRLAEGIGAFKGIGIAQELLEKRIGLPAVQFTSAHLADLKILYRSLKNGEVTKEEAFPDTGAADVTKSLQANATTAVKPAAAPAPAAVETKQPEPAQAAPETSAQTHPLEGTFKMLIDKVGLCLSERSLSAAIIDYAEEMELLRTEAPAFHKQVQAAIDAKRASKK